MEIYLKLNDELLGALFWSVADTDPLDLQSAVERAKEQGHNKADALLKGFSYFT